MWKDGTGAVWCTVLDMVRHFGTWSKRRERERDSVCAKGVGMEKLENGIGSSMLIINFVNYTELYYS